MTDTTVKVFYSTMSGAASLTNSAGSLITLLDACLCDGFGSVTLTSLVVADDVATATYSSGHNFATIGTTVGPVIRIAGSSVTGDNAGALNGDWRVTVTSSTEFTFATSGVSNQTATGTITAKRAPAGFEKAFSGTNKAAYRSLTVASTRLYCRIDDTVTQYPAVTMYETMSDVNTGTGASTAVKWPKYGNSSPAPWVLIADDRTVYLFVNTWTSYPYTSACFFGDINSYKSADLYHCMLIGGGNDYGTPYLPQLANNSYAWIARSYSQTGSAVSAYRYSHVKTTSGVGYGGGAYPSAAGNNCIFFPIEVWEGSWEGSTVPRGLLPGALNPIHTSAPNHGTIITDISVSPSREYYIQQMNVYRLGIDITGPWR